MYNPDPDDEFVFRSVEFIDEEQLDDPDLIKYVSKRAEDNLMQYLMETIKLDQLYSLHISRKDTRVRVGLNQRPLEICYRARLAEVLVEKYDPKPTFVSDYSAKYLIKDLWRRFKKEWNNCWSLQSSTST